MIHVGPTPCQVAAIMLASVPCSVGVGVAARSLLGCVRSRPASCRFLVSPLRGPSSAGAELRGCRHLGSLKSPGRHAVSSSAAILFSPVFTPRLSGGFPLAGAYLADHFRGLGVLLFRPGPVHSTGAPH
ncbi:hypothetical protein NDU88_002470 [Pleurodeles waltl]|uniref:Secreted protein n=1 Tax=Pleurodeles waltl TaxID=8319 RepID=A0AAV7UVQ0_PLEWA|nr:hypothetical protein NDU88_002470 [Pleurodeles waltl]